MADPSELTREIAPELPPNGQDHDVPAATDFNKLRIYPVEDKILIQRRVPREVTSGGIAIADAHQKKPVEGIVLAVGPGKREGKYIAMVRVPVGARVMFGYYAGVDLDPEYGERLLMCREDEILAILPPSAEDDSDATDEERQ